MSVYFGLYRSLSPEAQAAYGAKAPERAQERALTASRIQYEEMVRARTGFHPAALATLNR